jgi:hypothetical protein
MLFKEKHPRDEVLGKENAVPMGEDHGQGRPREDGTCPVEQLACQ